MTHLSLCSRSISEYEKGERKNDQSFVGFVDKI